MQRDPGKWAGWKWIVKLPVTLSDGNAAPRKSRSIFRIPKKELPNRDGEPAGWFQLLPRLACLDLVWELMVVTEE